MTAARVITATLLASGIAVAVFAVRDRREDAARDTEVAFRDAEPRADSLSWPDATDQAEFVAAHASLTRLATPVGAVLFDARDAEVIDRQRSSLPESHPLFTDADFARDDRVLVRLRLPGAGDERFDVVFTPGASGDYGFYVVPVGDSVQVSEVWGEVLAIPRAGEMRVFQRSNSEFAVVKRVRLDRGGLVDVPEERRVVGLRSVVLDTLRVMRSESDTSVVAVLAPGDSIVVVEVGKGTFTGGSAYHVRTANGVSGVARVPSSQCGMVVIRRLCFWGD